MATAQLGNGNLLGTLRTLIEIMPVAIELLPRIRQTLECLDSLSPEQRERIAAIATDDPEERTKLVEAMKA